METSTRQVSGVISGMAAMKEKPWVKVYSLSTICHSQACQPLKTVRCTLNNLETVNIEDFLALQCAH